MSKNRNCNECQVTELNRFHSLKEEKWREAENKSLIKKS